MDNGISFKSFSKEDELEEQAFRRKTHKRLIIITLSTIILVAVSICVIVGALLPSRETKSKQTPPPSSENLIHNVCNVTLYPNSCISSMTALESSSNNVNQDDPEELFKLSLQVSLNELIKISSLAKTLISSKDYDNTTLLHGSLHVCETLIDDAIEKLYDSISLSDEKFSLSMINDIRTWLSAAVTDQESCLDGLDEAKNEWLVSEMRNLMQNSKEFTSNSLAIVSNLIKILQDFRTPMHRKLLGIQELKDMKYLRDGKNPKPDLIVAKDGSGDFATINEALEHIPKRKKSRFVVYIKEGEYVENVNLNNDYWNVMMYGDGMNKTTVSGSLNFIDGTPTFSTATFAVTGRGFIGKDMGFKNTAGPEKEQAVAVRTSSDESIFYRCSFDAYQDTLYVFSNRQLFKDCNITGTIDFIFGNAAVVFQNCSIQPRQPLPNQFNAITAQGKSDPNQNTGISIQWCKVARFGNLTAPTYLGRPWKDYSTTVFMKSDIGDFLNPLGWAQWIRNVDPPSTIFYAEYKNSGPGSMVGGRVRWAGYRPNITEEEADKFSVESFIHVGLWK